MTTWKTGVADIDSRSVHVPQVLAGLLRRLRSGEAEASIAPMFDVGDEDGS